MNLKLQLEECFYVFDCVKIVRIWSYSGPHFPAFRLNTERYEVSLLIQSEYGKMRTRTTPNTDTFQAVTIFDRRNFSKGAGLLCVTFLLPPGIKR